MDAIFTSLIAMRDLKRSRGLTNFRTSSVYIVNQKMHGPVLAALSDKILTRDEQVLDLSDYSKFAYQG